MDSIKISPENLDAFKKEKELIPAPIDNKNVMTDWIEDIFDFQTCIWGKKMAVGIIAEEPAIVTWYDNILLWSFPSWCLCSIEGTKVLSELNKRLKVYDDANTELITTECVVGNLLMQKFYWKNED